MSGELPPLDGVLVADFSRVVAGPYATTMLADLGATVVKVERPGSGDETRSWGPPWAPGGSTSSYFAGVNRSKRSLTLDLAEAGDQQLAYELARRSDVLVENLRPGGMARYGLGPDDLLEVNPGLVYCSISGFGSEAGADLPGYDFLVQAVGGLMSITGEADGEPTKVGVAVVDVLTGKDAVIGILAALRRREQTGRGDVLEVSLLGSLLGGLINQASGYLATGTSPARLGNRHPSIAPYETLRCADAPLAVACGNDAQFRRLVEVLGRPELVGDPRFAANPDRVAHRDELVIELERVLGTDDADAWAERLTAARVPAGVVGDIGSAVQLADRLGLAPTVRLPNGSRQVRHPIGYRATATAEPQSPPGLGQHDAELRRWLASST